MSAKLATAKTVIDLKSIFEASKAYFEEEFRNKTEEIIFTIEAEGEALNALSEIEAGNFRFNNTSHVDSVTTGAAVTALTLPFLGPFALLAGMWAGGARGMYADHKASQTHIEPLKTKYGNDFYLAAGEFKRTENGATSFVKTGGYRPPSQYNEGPSNHACN